jgi:signal transduction histidine kinase
MTTPDLLGSVSRLGRRLPGWARTIRVRIALTYSALLFTVAALLLGGIYLALSGSIEARPLDPVTVQKFEKGPGGTVKYKPGGDFQAADITDVQEYVNYSTLESLRTYSVIGLAALFVLSLGIGWWVAGRVLRPVGAITASAREISATDLSRRIPETGPQDELRTLTATINGMLARIEASFTTQRELVDDVSHELRNPVAVVQSNVDAVLARDDVTREERAEAAAVVSRATTRMTGLLEDLLATARARSAAFVDEPVDLALLAQQVVEEFAQLAADRALRLTTRLPRGPLVIADPEALARAIGNLLSNAVRLAPPHSEVTVAAGSTAGWAWVAVRDQGPGVPAHLHERVFQRFSRSPDNPSTGHGLGLAITRQITEAHEGRVALFSAEAQGSTFVLWLPDREPAGPGQRDAQPPPTDPLGQR